VGDRVDAAVDSGRRRAISGNHTATHLLHAALRRTLGDHVKQSGSLVSAERLRFDFTHFSPLGREELRKIESLVNEKIRENLRVETRVVSLEEGVREGAMAIFEEKYGEKVRMVIIGEFSKEALRGGARPRHGGNRPLQESSPSRVSPRACGASRPFAGRRRSAPSRRWTSCWPTFRKALSAPRREFLQHVEKLKGQADEAEKEIKSLRQKMARLEAGGGEARVRRVKDHLGSTCSASKG